MRAARASAAMVLAALALGARAEQPFAARTGESGLLDVPDAKVVGAGRGVLGLEWRFDQPSGQPGSAGPLPLYAVSGLTDRLELGFTMREWGQPGDVAPAKVTYGLASKLRLFPEGETLPGLALGAIVDRISTDPVGGVRVIASTDRVGVQLSAFAGGELRLSGGGSSGATYGAAAAFGPFRDLTAIVEGLGGPRGSNVGAALRWSVKPTVAVQLGFNYLPSDEGFRVSVGIALRPPAPRRPETKSAQSAPETETETAVVASTPMEARPHFRLKMGVASPARLAEARRLQHAPYSQPAATTSLPKLGPAVRAPAPTMDELAEAKLREAEEVADGRERRVRATADQLDAREKAALAEVARHEARVRDLTDRESQLDAREKRLPKSAPTSEQRRLESAEAQLATQQRQLGAEERSFGPAVDAAEGRARDAAAREDEERQGVNRLAASIAGTSSRSEQVALRNQVLAARTRQLAAVDARLVARGERLDALEQQGRVRGARLDAWSRQLDTRAQRLDLIDRRIAGAAEGPETTRPLDAATAAPKDKSVFVMVVKSPTAIIRDSAPSTAATPSMTSPTPGAGAPAAPPVLGTHLPTEAVAAATVVAFPTPTSTISELDAEAVDRIAKLVAKNGGTLLIWARSKDPSLLAEAQRRVAEIRSRIVGSGLLDDRRVVTRITTRPVGQRIDVIVSALGDGAPKPTGEPAAPTAPASAPATAPGSRPASALQAGETAKRQIREAVQAVQPSIEACVGAVMSERKLERAEGVLRLTISPQGKVTHASATSGDLAGPAFAKCIEQAAEAWKFPSAEGEYSVDLPLTVLRGGPSR